MIFGDSHKSEQVHSITSWYPVLGWEKLPNFANFHTSDDVSSYKKNYYVSQEIGRLYKNIKETFGNGFESSNIRIMGDPGAGKTSFLYSLKHSSREESGDLAKFVFYILHINRVADNVENEVKSYIKDAWKEYYEKCGNEDHYVSIEQQNVDLKVKLNMLSDFFIQNRQKFSKVLIFILDDVDLLTGQKVAEIAECIMKNLEVASVKKWIVIRDISYFDYTPKTRAQIEHFFPDPFSFPTISLHELVGFRIKNTSKKDGTKNEAAKNPFSLKLCDEIVVKLCGNSLRQGLSLLKTILEDTDPGDIKISSNVGFISNYIENAAVNTFISSDKLLNLYDPRFKSSFFPCAVDILSSARYHNSYEIIFAAVNICCDRRDENAGRIIAGKTGKIKLREDDFKYSLEALKEFGLLQISEQKKINLTDKGKVHAEYVNRKHYFDKCFQKIYGDSLDVDYWKIAKVTVNQKEIVSKLLSWGDQGE